MFALCVESSHSKGMGHLFRALNFIEFLRGKNEKAVVFVNDDPVALSILDKNRVEHEAVDLGASGWEARLIDKYKVAIWINDRLDTTADHAERVKGAHIALVTLDDQGPGAALSDLHFAAFRFEPADAVRGRKIFRGPEYLILNKAIDRFKRRRTRREKILVTLGGSDTYGATVKVAKILKSLRTPADIITGPSFQHRDELAAVADENLIVKGSAASLIETMAGYDLAVVGGGITSFEACASGLPCIIVANELFERPAALYLDRTGAAVFAGDHASLDRSVFERSLDIPAMSAQGLAAVKTDGADKIYDAILHYA